MVRDQQLGGAQAGELIGQQSAIGELGDGELAGGVVHHGETDGFPVAADGGEVIRPLVVEQREVIDRAGREDARDLAFDEFAGFRLGRLFGDGNAFAGPEEAGEITLRGVIRHTAHGSATALGERHVEDGRGGFRILEKHFVKIPQAIEQDHIRGQGFPHGQILAHHRRARGDGHGRELEGACSRNQESLPDWTKLTGDCESAGQSGRNAIPNMA